MERTELHERLVMDTPLLELCPVCQDNGDDCVWCEDSGAPGYVAHDCIEGGKQLETTRSGTPTY